MFVCDCCHAAPSSWRCICSAHSCDQCKEEHKNSCKAEGAQVYVQLDLPPSFDQDNPAFHMDCEFGGTDILAAVAEQVGCFQKRSERLVDFIQKQQVAVVEALSAIISHYQYQSQYLETTVLDDFYFSIAQTLETYASTIKATFSGIKEVLDFAYGPLDSTLFYIKNIKNSQNSVLTRFQCQFARWDGRNLLLNSETPVVTKGAWDVLLPGQRKLLHTGGGWFGVQLQATAQLIDVVTGNVETVQNMHVPRKEHSGIRVDETVYVFGGKNSEGKLKKAEKYDVQQREWSNLPDMMMGRFKFNPVLYSNKIFLAGGCDRSIECLDLESLEFTLLPFTLNKDSPTITLLLPSDTSEVELVSFNQQGWQFWGFNPDAVKECGGRSLSFAFYMEPIRIGPLFYVMDFDKVKEINWESNAQSKEPQIYALAK